MIKIGITGQSGFIGSHLYNFLSIKKETTTLVSFKKEFFLQEKQLEAFVEKCDVIVHLAAVNRADNPDDTLYTNVLLVKKLIKACQQIKVNPKIIFSSSTQETLDNTYGLSKIEGFNLLNSWAKENNTTVVKIIIPNVFGPFGKPNYNSVIATFCHQLMSSIPLKIIDDNELRLIFINDLIEKIYSHIISKKTGVLSDIVPHTSTIKVSALKDILSSFHDAYHNENTFPNIANSFYRNLFITYMSYVSKSSFPKKLIQHKDERGAFSEVTRASSESQYSYSFTKPGVTRGNHYHTRKIERFVIIYGSAVIRLRKIKTDEVFEYTLEGETPSFIDIPVWHTHSITNVGETDLITLFWINECYDPLDPDTFIENVI
tara:strand:+ start:2413 stop:3534 length:1122 start_codon:yes stop_codon:yes gene_type:complete